MFLKYKNQFKNYSVYIKILVYIYYTIMEGINYDLEDKINLIYDYLYNLNSKNCFSFNKITLGKIGLDDIKISLPSNNQEEQEYYEKHTFLKYFPSNNGKLE